MTKTKLTRRDFMRLAAASPLAGAVFLHGKHPGYKAGNRKSRVILIRDEDALISGKQPNAEVVQSMLDEAVSALLDEKDIVKAWKNLVRPSDTVGIKSNVWRFIPTTTEVENAIKKRVMDTGVAEDKIGIDDRGIRNNPLFQNADALINARPARTHHWSGMGSLIKNYIMFVPKPPAYHGDSCADLARIWKEYNLIEKTKLNILVMLTPQFHSVGPHSYSDDYIWPYRGLIVSRDPVAADATGLRILLAKRQQHFDEEVPLETPAKHIRLAETRHGLGVADPEKIELIKLGWKENILI
jgi:hypothetical protein